MKLLIKRFKEIEDGTLGEFELFKDNEVVLKGYSLEPAGEDTIASGKDRRIPEGFYNTVPYQSPKFGKKLPLLYNEQVPKSRRILIHHGNFPDNTEGCILLGKSYDIKGVWDSRPIVGQFLELIKGNILDVEIRNNL